MSDTSQESERFRVLCADVENALKPHMSGSVPTGRRVWAGNLTTQGLFLYVEIAIRDSMPGLKERFGEWPDVTPTT